MNLQHIAYQESQLRKVLGAHNITDVASALNIDNSHLDKMIQRSNMTPDGFMLMIPKFINALVASNAHNIGSKNMAILQTFI
jgi:hypothetical protein